MPPSSRWPQRQPYVLGLLLSGRRVLVVGGGAVAQRRLPLLLRSGAEVTVVAPAVTPAVQRHVARCEVAWLPRDYRAGDAAGAWYVLAATDDAAVNAAVAAEAEAQQTFCVRADRAERGSAFTPATGEVDGTTVAVLSADGPRRAAAVRDVLVQAVSSLRRRLAA